MDIKKINKPKDENLNLKELHPMLMKYFTNTLFIAPTGVGKTNLIINLLDRPRFYKNKFDKIILFSNTYHNDKIWKACKSIDEENVHVDYSDEKLKEIDEILFIDNIECGLFSEMRWRRARCYGRLLAQPTSIRSASLTTSCSPRPSPTSSTTP